MRRLSSPLRLATAFVWILVFAFASSAQTTEVRLADDSVFATNGVPVPSPPELVGHLPVLFVHGHNLDSDQDADFNYRNWQDRLDGLPSFKLAMEANGGLGIEPYYIRFVPQHRSITEDAADISAAIELILHRHDTNYPAQATHVQVVIIAYSKGTISARQYLKSLQTQVPGMPAPRPGFRPVSEFIAISPPNHGLSSPGFDGTTSLPLQQLHNGFRPGNLAGEDCGVSFNEPLATDYITNLNGQDEAPDSRSTTEPRADGILYVTLFADGNRDSVGGDTPSDDCLGRRLAINLSSDADNIEVLNIDGVFRATVHQNTVHTSAVICKALFAAVHHRSPRTQTCPDDSNDIPIIPPPTRAAAMLTLDFSGSMLAPAPPHPSRAAVLKEAVELFVKLWTAVSLPGDRLGVTYFRTAVAGGETLPLLNDPANDAVGSVDAQMPSGRTAMGGGLQRAITTLGDPSVEADIRRVILFTDGMQNVNPMVQTVGSQLVIADQPSPPAAPLTVLDTSLGIAVDTIGIGAGGDFVNLLQDIADKTGGRFSSTIDPAVDLRRFFVEELINALKGFSPQLVAYRRGAIAAKGSTEAFDIEDGVRKLVLKVSWKRGEAIDFTVNKDGVDVTPAGRVINGAFYKIFAIELPAKGPITARGNWQMRINGKAATSYEAAAIVDGGHISYDARFDAQLPRVGDALNLVVRLTAGGRPTGGSVTVTVDLINPTNTPGDIIAMNPPKDLPAFEPGMSVAERQLLALTLDPKRLAGLKPKRQKLVLQPNDRGEFRAALRPQVPGTYTAFVTIEGGDSRIGQFSRTLTATTVVRFAKADPKRSDINVIECTDVGGRRYIRLVVTPRDAGGHYLGPGSPSAISARLSAGRIVGGVRDLGDGSYMLLLDLLPADDPTINLEVGGAELLIGRVSQLSGKSRL